MKYDLTAILEGLAKEELVELLALIPEEIKERIEIEKKAIRDSIILYYKEINSLGRNIYTIKEIARLVNTKEYIVADAIKEYKNNLKDV